MAMGGEGTHCCPGKEGKRTEEFLKVTCVNVNGGSKEKL